MRERLVHLTLCLLAQPVLLAQSSCGRAAAPERTGGAQPIEFHVERAPYASPATYRYHPRVAGRQLARQALDQGVVLHAGERGERWLVPSKHRVAEGASSLAPEDLVAVLASEGRAYRFVGRSGTVYESESPLGPFVRALPPSAPVSAVSAAEGALIGVRTDGLLARSEGDSGWHLTGPTSKRFVDVVLLPGGSALALALPEELWRSNDKGASWQRLSMAPIGAHRLERAAVGVLVEAVFGPRLWRPSSDALTTVSSREASTHVAESFAIPRGPSATALAEGRAVIAGDRYYEIEWAAEGAARLIVGALERPLPEGMPLPIPCRFARVAAFGRFVAVACGKRAEPGHAQRFELLRSNDGGASFDGEPLAFYAIGSMLALAAGGANEVLLTGACAAHEADDGCGPWGVHYLRAKRRIESDAGVDAASSGSQAGGSGARAFELAVAVTPGLDGPAQALTFAYDGRAAYAVGMRAKLGRPAVFVSSDGGRTFRPRDLPLQPFDTRRRRASQGTSVRSLVPAEDGTLALVVTVSQGTRYVVLDDEGSVLSLASPPSSDALVAAAGSRAVALDPSTQRLFESTDAGATWVSTGPLPVPLCRSEGSCDATAHCAPVGCVFGDALSRIGWRGKSMQGMASLPPTQERQPLERRVRSPFICTVDEAGWRPLPHVTRPPSAHEAALGRAAWFAVGIDSERASVLSYHGVSSRLETNTLLAPVKDPGSYALYVSDQVEGAAALRYPTPDTRSGESHIRNVEVIWDNLFEGKLYRRVIEDAGAYVTGDYQRGSGLAQLARPSLLSIASSGLYLRIHAAPGNRQPTLFIGPSAVDTIPPVDWPKATLAGGRAELVHVEGRHVPLLLFGPAAVARATAGGAPWTFDAFTMAPPPKGERDNTRELGITYRSGRAALYVYSQSGDRVHTRGELFEISATGPVVREPTAIATQGDIKGRPLGCSQEVRDATARLVVPYQAGTRHPVLVNDPDEPQRVLISSAAVMYGTRETACAAAFEAVPASEELARDKERLRALLLLPELDRSYLFRAVRPLEDEASMIEYRLMRCRLDPGLAVPSDVYRAPGTHVPLAAPTSE